MSEPRTITAAEFHSRERKKGHIDLIDVRTPVEFREVHAGSARNVPLGSLDPEEEVRGKNGKSEEPFYLICRTGSRARLAAGKFQRAGVENVILVEGGIDAWVAEGLPVVRGKNAMSLERQVRIAAGALVVVGSFLGFFASPYFIALPAFVGAGLVFAGATNTCGMGMLLARMPWNTVGGECDGCQG